MVRSAILLFLFLGSVVANAQSAQVDLCEQFNRFNDSVNTGKINKLTARVRMKFLLDEIKTATNIQSGANWIFPLKGYDHKAVGGYKGNGYNDKGYRYLDGNKHAAHPAHDIFITDRNQDNIDDKTQKAVDVLCIDNGIVIACADDWQPASLLRGGNFIWVYHPRLQSLSYYAHNSKIFVKPGDVVKQGEKIAEVGRTGFNAYKKRSPTHLHFSAFHIINGLPVPYNCYNQLVGAKAL